MKSALSVTRWLLVAALVTSAPACLAAAAAAGAGGAIYATTRGAASTVAGSPGEVFATSVAVFQEMGIRRTGESSEDDGVERELRGTIDDMEITVHIEAAEGSTSTVEVTARENAVEYDKEYAEDILRRIVARR
ncbi:hypothetical protein BH20GEM2_BH20GEM2_10440 [soil metagenome]